MCGGDIGIRVLRQDRVFWFVLLFVLFKNFNTSFRGKIILELTFFWTEKVKLTWFTCFQKMLSTQFSTNGRNQSLYIFFNAVQQLNQDVTPFACFLSYWHKNQTKFNVIRKHVSDTPFKDFSFEWRRKIQIPIPKTQIQKTVAGVCRQSLGECRGPAASSSRQSFLPVSRRSSWCCRLHSFVAALGACVWGTLGNKSLGL